MKKTSLDRIVTAPPLWTDAESLFACIERNRLHLKNLVWVENATLESTRDFLDQMDDSRVEMFSLIIDEDIEVDGDYVVGAITLRDQGSHYNIGFWIDKEYCGRGVMTKIVREHLGYYADKAVHARIRVANKASRRVLEKNGFLACTDEHDPEWIMFKLNVV